MANEHTAFWLTLLDRGHDAKQRARLWNGYLGWKLPPQSKDEALNIPITSDSDFS